ncbi:MAG: type II toxin-antitoxin system VapC family toxin [Thiotrichaceae bacterium]|nr:type II toxin-antitoxin system VapC family toxin [Thiotrichaceae bacterium]
MKYLLDTNIILEPMKLQANIGVMNRLALDSIFSCTSATVWHELWHGVKLLNNGVRKNELESYLNLLNDDGFTVLPYCQKAAEWLAEERVRLKTKGITPAKYDSEIAAVAAVNQLIIVTGNIEDFSFFHGLSVENWFDL